MSTVCRRGFNLVPCAIGEHFPTLNELRLKIQERGASQPPYDRGYSCGKAACDFGMRAPRKALAEQMSRWVKSGQYTSDEWNVVDEAIRDVLTDRDITIYERVGELDRLRQGLALYEELGNESVLELAWELSLSHSNELVQDLQNRMMLTRAPYDQKCSEITASINQASQNEHEK